MHQFLQASEAAFAELHRRAQTGCVCFAGQELPPGAEPARARIGFQVNADGSASLYVERGIAYRGAHAGVKDWLARGELRRHSFAALCHWIRHELAGAYTATGQRSSPEQEPARQAPDELTDLAAVRQEWSQEPPLLRLDAQALAAELQKTVRGQDGALRLLARRVCQHAARRAPRRPTTLFAVGPTGVGKTRTAESLPQALRTLDPAGAGYSYLRLDMSEYQERHRMSQLLGAPQGYVGYGEGAQLLDALASNPRTIVLFDEIEKAHPDVLRTLMNAMDAGRLSSPARTTHGRNVDCQQAIFLFTSNLECDGILEDLEEREGAQEPEVVDAICRKRLRQAGLAPELIGRIGGFLVFRPLSLDARAEIMVLSVVRVAAEYGLTVERVAPGVVLTLLRRSRGGEFGVRPDEYLVEDLLGDCFARTAQECRQGPLEIRAQPEFVCVPYRGDVDC